MDQPKVSPRGESSGGSQVAELCQWEVTDPEGNKITGTMADIGHMSLGGTGAPSEESGLPALTATQKQMLCPTAPENLLHSLLVQRSSLQLPSRQQKPLTSQSEQANQYLYLEGVRELQVPSEPGRGPA